MKTRLALSREAFFYPGPLRAHPAADGGFIALAGPALGLLRTEPERAKKAADMVGVIGHPQPAPDQIGHPCAGPQIGRVAERGGALDEHAGELVLIAPAQLARAARHGHRRQRLDSVVPVSGQPAMHRATIHPESRGDLARTEAVAGKLDRPEPALLKRASISVGSHVSPPGGSMRHYLRVCQ
jgi:hypothetical protein